ncbi:IS1/IS1595 family N-terminal zinc-binding domain-containing protein [Microcoleus sp. herbarium2]
MSLKSANCPKCQSRQIIKYGHTDYDKPRFAILHVDGSL